MGVRGGAAKLNHTVFNSMTQETVFPFPVFDARLAHVALVFICAPLCKFVEAVSGSTVGAVEAIINCRLM